MWFIVIVLIAAAWCIYPLIAGEYCPGEVITPIEAVRRTVGCLILWAVLISAFFGGIAYWW